MNNENVEFYSVSAGGAFGSRQAIYKLVEGVLVLRDEGNHDNLVGNDLACSFEGLTVEQANEKIEALNSEGSGHNYDGCHACTWSISLDALEIENVPAHLTYNEPSEAFAIREALNRARSNVGRETDPVGRLIENFFRRKEFGP